MPRLPETLEMFRELVKPDQINILWWEPLDIREPHQYFRVGTKRAMYLVRQEGHTITVHEYKRLRDGEPCPRTAERTA